MRIWRQKPLQREYISELDRFLISFDKRACSSSASRRAVEAEYAKLDWMRDHAETTPAKNRLWKKF